MSLNQHESHQLTHLVESRRHASFPRVDQTPWTVKAVGSPVSLKEATFGWKDIETIERRVDLLFGSPLLTDPGPRSLVASYEQIDEPHALLDASLAFVYQNPSFRTFLRRYAYPVASSLVRTFARALNTQEPREIIEALASPTAGYAWTGLILHRRRDVKESMTKIHVRPFWTGGTSFGKPTAYTVFIDDVTLEHKRFLHDNLNSLLRASLQKDRDTAIHVERVNCYARSMAEVLYHDSKWPEVDLDFIENIGFLAALHDIGKIGTPDEILNKEGPLDAFEWKVMKEHTSNGASILSTYPNPMAMDIALSHHEWWNGSGYPNHLEGIQIPLAARIVSLVDVYDALRMKRSYKASLFHDEAMTLIRQGSGIQFDPALVDVVVHIQDQFAQIYAAHQG